MSSPGTETPIRCEVGKPTEQRTGACTGETGQQLPLPFTNWRPKVGDNASTPESGTLISAAASTKELHSIAVAATLLDATAIRRRGPSLSRRIGQKGSGFQHSQKWDPAGKTYGRFWVDVPSRRRQRRTVALGVCRTPSVPSRKYVHIVAGLWRRSNRPWRSTRKGGHWCWRPERIDRFSRSVL